VKSKSDPASPDPAAEASGVAGLPATAAPPLRADDVARFLAQRPDFFEQHPQVLLSLRIPHESAGVAVSLLERQAQLLRERARGLEARLSELMRHGAENDAIVARIVRWAAALLRSGGGEAAAVATVEALKAIFDVPHAAARLFDADPQAFAAAVADPAAVALCEPVDREIVRVAGSLEAPYCGANAGFAAARWLGEDLRVGSIAMVPLRRPGESAAFGLLVLGAPDPDRFQSAMGTELLSRIGELAAAALAPLSR